MTLQIFDSQMVFTMLVRAIVLLTAIPIHECAHALVADKLGDPTARNLGRITLNPLAHLDPIGSLLLMLTGFGWAKPVPIATRHFSNIKRDMALSAIAGPLSNLLLALVAMVLFKSLFLLQMSGAMLAITQTAYDAVGQILWLMITINVGLAIFNLLPIPPLDGSRLLTALLPPKLYFGIMRYERYFMFGLFAIMYLGVFTVPMALMRMGVMSMLDWLTGFIG